MLDDLTWQALTVVLTLVAGGWTYYAWQHRGTASAVRGGAITLLPVSAYLTGTLKVVGRTADAVVDWATGLVFSPVVWTGFALFGLSVLLFVVSGWLSSREPTGSAPAAENKSKKQRSQKKQEATQLNQGKGSKSEPVVDDDMDDIEAILKKRGIS